MPRSTALLLFVALAASACAAPRCRNQIARRVASPDNARDAILYHRDCGEGPSTEVAVIPHDADLPDLPTNVLGLSRSEDVAISWSGPAELRLSYPGNARVVGRMDRTLDGAVAVTFDPR